MTKTITADPKRTAILAAALEMMTEKGFHGTPMSELIKRANVGAGTVYRHFKNKEDMINVLYWELREKMDLTVFADLPEGVEPRELFQTVWKNVLNYYINNPVDFKFLEQYYYSPFKDQQNKKNDIDFQEPVTAFFAKFQQENELKNLPPFVMLCLVYGPIVSLAKMQIGGFKLDEITIQKAADACWDMIKKG